MANNLVSRDSDAPASQMNKDFIYKVMMVSCVCVCLFLLCLLRGYDQQKYFSEVNRLNHRSLICKTEIMGSSAYSPRGGWAKGCNRIIVRSADWFALARAGLVVRSVWVQCYSRHTERQQISKELIPLALIHWKYAID